MDWKEQRYMVKYTKEERKKKCKDTKAVMWKSKVLKYG